jgi:hypothetical protein
MPEPRLEELETLYAQTTPGVWRSLWGAPENGPFVRHDHPSIYTEGGEDVFGITKYDGAWHPTVTREDAAFVVAVHAAFPWLLEAARLWRAMSQAQTWLEENPKYTVKAKCQQGSWLLVAVDDDGMIAAGSGPTAWIDLGAALARAGEPGEGKE